MNFLQSSSYYHYILIYINIIYYYILSYLGSYLQKTGRKVLASREDYKTFSILCMRHPLIVRQGIQSLLPLLGKHLFLSITSAIEILCIHHSPLSKTICCLPFPVSAAQRLYSRLKSSLLFGLLVVSYSTALRGSSKWPQFASQQLTVWNGDILYCISEVCILHWKNSFGCLSWREGFFPGASSDNSRTAFKFQGLKGGKGH